MNQICHFRLKAASATSALILSGCVTVPEVPARPEISKVEASFDSAKSLIFDVGEVNSSWWQNFDDPLMTTLVESALAHNKDIAVAEANIGIAQAFLNRQGLTQTSSTRSLGGANLGRQARDGADIEITADAQIGASWEYDAFGRIASIIDSAELDLLSAQELRRDVAVIIASETALAYTDLRGNQVLLAVAQTNADLQGESLDLLRTLFENGRATRLDLERAEAQFRATLASLPVFEADIRTAAARLVSLTGQTSLNETLMVETALETAEQTPVPPTMFAVASPEALIRRRPDIRVAEADIASLLALGQAERARLFPTLTFDANLFSLFSEGNDLGDSFGFGIGPSIVWDGPDLRRVRADIDLTDAQTVAAYARYEAAVVNALGEVEISLIRYAQEQARREDLEAAAGSAERAVGLARLRFEEGLDDFLDVIDAQRTLLDAQGTLENSRLNTTRLAIAAYRSLGGIWETEELDAVRQTGVRSNAP